MSFARWNGALKDGLVKGKAYGCKDAMGGSAAGAGMVVLLGRRNLPGPTVAYSDQTAHVTGEGMKDWEVAEKAYAVVLKDKLEDWKRGEVVVVTDWTEDGKLEVEGLGYVAADGLELLDRTNVTPGIRVLEGETWRRVVAVDDALWVRVNGEFKSPEEFVFPVSHDGDLLSEPIVTCLKDSWAYNKMPGITVGKRYYLESTKRAGVELAGDDGTKRHYPAELFRMG